MSARDVALFDLEEATAALDVEELRFVASFAASLARRSKQLRTALDVVGNPILCEASIRTSLGIAGHKVEGGAS